MTVGASPLVADDHVSEELTAPFVASPSETVIMLARNWAMDNVANVLARY